MFERCSKKLKKKFEISAVFLVAILFKHLEVLTRLFRDLKITFLGCLISFNFVPTLTPKPNSFELPLGRIVNNKTELTAITTKIRPRIDKKLTAEGSLPNKGLR